MPIKMASQKTKSADVFGQGRRLAKRSRGGLYALVSIKDRQTLNWGMRKYAAATAGPLPYN
jgi:hypothetical protein